MGTPNEVVSDRPAEADGESSLQGSTLPRRRRIQTVFYEPDQPSRKKAFHVEKGNGVQLREIPSVSSQLARWRADEPVLLELHRILYKRIGKRMRRKRDIGDFSGFVFTDSERDYESENLKERIASVKNLKRFIDLFNLPQKSGKEQMVVALVEFLMNPVDTSIKAKVEEKTAPKKPNKQASTTKKRPKEPTVKKTKSTKKRQRISSNKKKQVEENEEEEEGDDYKEPDDKTDELDNPPQTDPPPVEAVKDEKSIKEDDTDHQS